MTRQIDLICGGILAKIRAAATVQNGGDARGCRGLAITLCNSRRRR